MPNKKLEKLVETVETLKMSSETSIEKWKEVYSDLLAFQEKLEEIQKTLLAKIK